MDPRKCTYYIDGCNRNFKQVDWTVYATTEMVENEAGEIILIPCPSKYDGHIIDYGPTDGTIEYQHIILNVPDNIFDVDMEYVCIRQNEDTGLEIIREEDIKKGDTAARILLPSRYFLNRLDCHNSCHPKDSATIKDCQYVTLDLFVGVGLYLAHW